MEAIPAGKASGIARISLLSWWSPLPLLAKVLASAVATILLLGGAAWGALAAWGAIVGSAEVRVENVDCVPFEPPTGLVRRLSSLLPVLEVPSSPIGPGTSGTFRVPAGTYEVEVTGSSLRGRWWQVEASGSFGERLRSLTFDGRELVGAGPVMIELEEGSSHIVRASCR